MTSDRFKTNTMNIKLSKLEEAEVFLIPMPDGQSFGSQTDVF